MRGISGLILAFALASVGCSSIASSAIATGPRRAPYAGPVRVVTSGQPVTGADLGIVEAHAAQTEANVETLVPVFVARVARLGGNVAVIDHVEARFDLLERMHAESYSYPCGFHATCVGTRWYPVHEEVMVLSMQGRAVAAPTGSLP